MLGDKVPLQIASQRLGHRAIVIAADLYQHVTASMEQAAAARLAGVLDRASGIGS